MGYSATAYTVIGYELEKSSCVTAKNVPGCRCKLTDAERDSYKFCPQCGKKTYQVEEEYLFEDEDNYPDLGYEVREDYDARKVYVGIIQEGDSDNSAVLSFEELVELNIKEMAQEIKDRLADLGIQVKLKDFGIHTFLYESY